MISAVRRRLNDIEYLNWCVDQPYNLAVSIRVRGPVTADGVRTALDALQRRHPLLTATTVVDADGRPWLDSAGVGPIPLHVTAQAEDDEARRVLDHELSLPFSMDWPAEGAPEGPPAGTNRPALLRATLLRATAPDDATDLVLCAQHVIADGLSLFFVTRDLVRLLRDPGTELEVLDAAASPAEILPPRVVRRLPRSSRRLRVLIRLLRGYRSLHRPDRGDDLSADSGPVGWTAPVHSWQLTPDRTSALLARCRAEGVSVQSALGTAFLTGYTAVNSPVSLRGRLARDVGESVGLFVGTAVVRAGSGLGAASGRTRGRSTESSAAPWAIRS